MKKINFDNILRSETYPILNDIDFDVKFELFNLGLKSWDWADSFKSPIRIDLIRKCINA